jgi:anhydro-N-acetylmuramic acid kinase
VGDAPRDKSELYIGIMSGTSMDGVDAVLADCSGGGAQLLGHVHRGFAADLRAQLGALQASGADELERAARAALGLAHDYAQAIGALLQQAGVPAPAVRAAGIHGQTVRHRPRDGYTIQLNAPAAVAELTGIDVVADFRSRDVAAGGEGAPLLPVFHAAMFTADRARAVLNLGGIANLTGLPPKGDAAPVIGFDTGPGNVLLDLWCERHRGAPYDDAGRWAAQGRVQSALLAALLDEAYFDRAPPKSTGRDLFNAPWLDARLAAADPARALALVDVQATLARLTAESIARALKRWWPQATELVVCGGGAFNGTLLKLLGECSGGLPVRSSADLGVAPDHVEALAFAWLARAHLRREGGNLPAVTGARGLRVLGACYPK